MQENYPVLISCKPLKNAYETYKKICISSEEFTLGRGLKNCIVVPFLAISRNHCLFRKTNDEWIIEDFSTFGIEVNGDRLGKGMKRTLCNDDIITLEPSKEFVYKFINRDTDVFETPKKKMKLDINNCDIINSVKSKFEESQSFEIKHIEEKILNAKQMQTTSKILKAQLESDMNRKINQLESDFALQIENLKGEKNEVERQKAMLLEERDAQLCAVKVEMDGKISELMQQIHKLNEAESELLNENNLLKEKLLKERNDFLNELSRESSSKQDMLEKLEAKIKEQDEVRLKEKQELEDMLRKETEQLRLAKEKELRDLEEQKQLRELELVSELNNIKKNLEDQMVQTEQQRVKAEQLLNEQMEHMKKLSDEEKAKMDQLVRERQEIEKQLADAQSNAEKSVTELKNQVQQKVIELETLSAERRQAEQTSEVINSLQEQLEKVKSQLQQVETEKNTLLEYKKSPSGEGSSKQTTLEVVEEVLDSELQCSVCGELFISATTLNCSHTFCKYCITMWKKKKKDCPICRSPITSECKSLVLDSLIEKMNTLSEDMKKKRQELLAAREELEANLALPDTTRRTSRGSDSYDDSEYYSQNSEEGEGEGSEVEGYDEYDEADYYDDWFPYRRRRYYSSSESDSGSDDSAAPPAAPLPRAPAAPPAPPAAPAAVGGAAPHAGADSAGAAVPGDPAQRTDNNGAGGERRRRGRVPGRPGAVYGGYGRCYCCGARGHWAPGCPNR